jgi:hypothetical protein
MEEAMSVAGGALPELDQTPGTRGAINCWTSGQDRKKDQLVLVVVVLVRGKAKDRPLRVMPGKNRTYSFASLPEFR